MYGIQTEMHNGIIQTVIRSKGQIAAMFPSPSDGHYFIANAPTPLGSDWYVDGNVSASGDGKSRGGAFKTIQEGVNAMSKFDRLHISPITMLATDTDPGNYAEVITITTPQISLIGDNTGRTQGGLPQIKKGSGSTPLITIQAPGCLIANLGLNGGSANGGGIKIDDNGGSTKSAFGTTITNCHFKNCTVTANDGRTGGAIWWPSVGNGWQVLIDNCRFYKNTADIVVVGTGGSVPQDIIIQNCVMSGPAASVDVNIYTGGSGVSGLHILGCDFPALPALSAGQVKRFMMLTGSIGKVSGCNFGAAAAAAAEFKVGGSQAEVPATMFLTGCFVEGSTLAARS